MYLYIFLGKPKAPPYIKIQDRSYKFETEGEIDTYIRLKNQSTFAIRRNNPVKCSIKDCTQLHTHKMTKKYLHCNCKQVTCDLKYSYQYCEHAGDWELYTIGHHPHIIDHVRQEYGLPLQVKVIIEELLESDPDLKL